MSEYDRNRPLPKESRTIPVYGHPVKGEGKDADRYFRCWNCGFICDAEKDALGGSASRSGVTHTESIISPERYGQGSIDYLCLPRGKSRILANDATGNPKPVYHYQAPDSEVSSGCPFCHSKNWRGDY